MLLITVYTGMGTCSHERGGEGAMGCGGLGRESLDMEARLLNDVIVYYVERQSKNPGKCSVSTGGTTQEQEIESVRYSGWTAMSHVVEKRIDSESLVDVSAT